MGFSHYIVGQEFLPYFVFSQICNNCIKVVKKETLRGLHEGTVLDIKLVWLYYLSHEVYYFLISIAFSADCIAIENNVPWRLSFSVQK